MQKFVYYFGVLIFSKLVIKHFGWSGILSIIWTSDFLTAIEIYSILATLTFCNVRGLSLEI